MWLQFISVCVRVCVVGVSGVGVCDIVSYKLTQKHVSPYRMVSVNVCVCVHVPLKNAN